MRSDRLARAQEVLAAMSLAMRTAILMRASGEAPSKIARFLGITTLEVRALLHDATLRLTSPSNGR